MISHQDADRTRPHARTWRAAAWLLAAWLALLPAARADEPEDATAPPARQTRLAFEGKAVVQSMGSLGQEEFRYGLTVTNTTAEPIAIRAANLLLVHRGGWLLPKDPESFTGSFFSEAPTLSAQESLPVAGQVYRADTPATHVLFAARAADGHAEVVVPIERSGFPLPPAHVAPYSFGVGVVGPLHALPWSDGKDAVLLIGQHQVLSGEAPDQVRTSVQIGSDAGATEAVAWEGLDAEGDLVALWPFVRRVDVFSGLKGGVLRLESSAQVAGRAETMTATWPVQRVEPVAVRAPVLGTWQAVNGPGRREFIDHYANPQNRYAYDFVVVEQGRTHRGDPHANESYFAWNRSVRAVAAGEVVDVCVRERDNPGYRGAQTLCYNNRVVVRHDDGVYTAYLHLRQRSVTRGVLLGSRVKAGQVIARVGNSGDSSEPHLHFMAFRIDAHGRAESVPLTFTNAYHDAAGTRPVRGVPLGGRIYHFRNGGADGR